VDSYTCKGVNFGLESVGDDDDFIAWDKIWEGGLGFFFFKGRVECG
jgi:hypothetical protein